VGTLRLVKHIGKEGNGRNVVLQQVIILLGIFIWMVGLVCFDGATEMVANVSFTRLVKRQKKATNLHQPVTSVSHAT
jgi:hypothetical protein